MAKNFTVILLCLLITGLGCFGRTTKINWEFSNYIRRVSGERGTPYTDVYLMVGKERIKIGEFPGDAIAIEDIENKGFPEGAIIGCCAFNGIGGVDLCVVQTGEGLTVMGREFTTTGEIGEDSAKNFEVLRRIDLAKNMKVKKAGIVRQQETDEP